MINILISRIKQGFKTIPFPNPKISMPERFRGSLSIDKDKCKSSCNDCINICPTNAIKKTNNNESQVDLGKCLFCLDCKMACKAGAISHNKNYSLSAKNRNDLIIKGNSCIPALNSDNKIKKIFGRSLKLRQVSAGGCNACEADINVLNTIGFDLGRFGVQIVASPRHADGLIITGPVSKNMKLALLKTYEATPSPKIVIAVGACAISGGLFVNHAEVENGADNLLPVDLYIPGCPPHPLTILDGILKLIGKIK